MFTKDIKKDVINRLTEKLGTHVDVVPGAGQLQTEEDLKELATRVSVKPHIIVNVGRSVEMLEDDTTSRIPKDQFAIETVVVVSDNRNRDEQSDLALRYVYGTRYALSGYKLETDYTADGPITFDRSEEEFNLDGICAYAVNFTVDLFLDLDDFEL